METASGPGQRLGHPAGQWHSATATAAVRRRHDLWRYAQIIPIGLFLWGTDAIDRFRADAATVGMHNAPVVDAISDELGGSFARHLNLWLLGHPIEATAAAWYYVVLQGAVTAVVGLLLIWRRAPSFKLHRDALIGFNLVGLVVFYFYPVAPPRLLPGYHDITADAVPLFSSLLEGKAADQFGSLPSLHVTWALWAAIAAGALMRKPLLRALLWLYPAATVLDVLVTANHYWLDVIAAPVVLLLGYALAAGPELARRRGVRLSLHPAEVLRAVRTHTAVTGAGLGGECRQLGQAGRVQRPSAADTGAQRRQPVGTGRSGPNGG